MLNAFVTAIAYPSNGWVLADNGMALTKVRIAGGLLRNRAAASPSWPTGALGGVLPFIIILVRSAAVRLPFYGISDGDEFFFSVVAGEWLRGGLPYVDAFDIKPPGIFLVYAIAQAIFGASYATIKGLEMVAVAAGASAIFAMLRSFGSGRLAIWAAALYPVYTSLLAAPLRSICSCNCPSSSPPLPLSFWQPKTWHLLDSD